MKKLVSSFVSTFVLITSSWATAQNSGFTLPETSSKIAVPAGQKMALTLLGRGTQNYACQAKADKTGFE